MSISLSPDDYYLLGMTIIIITFIILLAKEN